MEGISRVRGSFTWTHTDAHWGGRVRSIYELEMAELEGVMDDGWIVGEEGLCQKAKKAFILSAAQDLHLAFAHVLGL